VLGVSHRTRFSAFAFAPPDGALRFCRLTECAPSRTSAHRLQVGTAMTLIDKLAPLRGHAGQRRTAGLDDATVLEFAARHPELAAAVDAAADEYERVKAEFPELLDLDEDAQVQAV
jgi:hypothetical protein